MMIAASAQRPRITHTMSACKVATFSSISVFLTLKPATARTKCQSVLAIAIGFLLVIVGPDLIDEHGYKGTCNTHQKNYLLNVQQQQGVS